MIMLKFNELIFWNGGCWVLQPGPNLGDKPILVPVKLDPDREYIILTAKLEQQILEGKVIPIR
jgi:hypothetical protein